MAGKYKSFTEYPVICGAKQYLLHYPASGEAPVLLFIHGGPGFSEAFAAYLLKDMWQDSCHIVMHDQRGCGKTQQANKGDDTPVTFGQILEDIDGVVDHVRKEYGVDKVAMMGHSWGTVVSSQYALKHPDKLSVLINVGQFMDITQNERRSYDKLREKIVASGSEKDLAVLDGMGFFVRTPDPDKAEIKKLKALSKLRVKYKIGYLGLDFKLLSQMLRSPQFKLADLSDMGPKGGERSRKLLEFLMTYNLADSPPVYGVPVAYLLGDNDYQTVTPLAVEYFETIEAPFKMLRLIPGAGHATMLDNPGAFTAALKEALKDSGAGRYAAKFAK